jgi:hypothetical protein
LEGEEALAVILAALAAKMLTRTLVLQAETALLLETVVTQAMVLVALVVLVRFLMQMEGSAILAQMVATVLMGR